MWLNEFKTGDIVEDRFGNVIEIKQIFKTGNVKIKILESDMMEISDFVGNIIDKNSVGKTYTVYPFGEFENDWKIKVDQKVEELTVEQIDSKILEFLTSSEQIDSKISELQKRKSEIIKKQIDNIIPGKFYQIVDIDDAIYVYNSDAEINITNSTVGYIVTDYIDDECVKSITPLPELDEAYSKFLKLLEEFT